MTIVDICQVEEKQELELRKRSSRNQSVNGCEELAHQYQSGDEDAFNQLYERTENHRGNKAIILSPRYTLLDIDEIKWIIDSALFYAARKYDPTKTRKSFIEYLNQRIKWELSKEQRRVLGHRGKYRKTRSLDAEFSDGFTLGADIEDRKYSLDDNLDFDVLREREIRTFEDNEEFPEKTIARLLIEYRCGNMEALGEMYRLTESFRTMMVNVKKARLPSYVHMVDVETEMTDALIEFADNFDLERYHKKGDIRRCLAGFCLKGNMRWLYKIYPQLRGRDCDRSQSSLNFEPQTPDNVGEFIEKDHLKSCIARALDKLTQRDRKIFYKTIVLGNRSYDIAESLGISVYSVWRGMEVIRSRFRRFTPKSEVAESVRHLRDSVEQYFLGV